MRAPARSWRPQQAHEAGIIVSPITTQDVDMRSRRLQSWRGQNQEASPGRLQGPGSEPQALPPVKLPVKLPFTGTDKGRCCAKCAVYMHSFTQ